MVVFQEVESGVMGVHSAYANSDIKLRYINNGVCIIYERLLKNI